MTSEIRVLVIDEDPSLREECQAWVSHLDAKVLKASEMKSINRRLSDGDIHIIIVGQTSLLRMETLIARVKKIRDNGFRGQMIAAAALLEDRLNLIKAGCSWALPNTISRKEAIAKAIFDAVLIVRTGLPHHRACY